MYGPFDFPQNTQPISPIIWLGLLEKDAKLMKPLKITLPHCLAEQTLKKIHHHQVCVVKASHADHTDIDSEIHYNFTHYNFTRCEFAPHSCTFETDQCGLYCINKVRSLDSTSSDLKYCLACVARTPSPPEYEFHFYALLDLATHKNVKFMLHVRLVLLITILTGT